MKIVRQGKFESRSRQGEFRGEPENKLPKKLLTLCENPCWNSYILDLIICLVFSCYLIRINSCQFHKVWIIMWFFVIINTIIFYWHSFWRNIQQLPNPMKPKYYPTCIEVINGSDLLSSLSLTPLVDALHEHCHNITLALTLKRMGV